MGYLGYVYVESKSFEVRSDVCGGVCLEERSKGLSHSVIMVWPTIFWLLAAWDSLTPLEKVQEKWRSFIFGSKVYVLLRRNNKFGNFLELLEYGEKGRRSFVIIPEGEEQKGWTDCCEQLSKLKQFHDKQKLGGSLPGVHLGKILAGSVGLNKGQLIISLDHTSLQGDQKSYAEAVQGNGHILKLNPQSMAGKCKVGESVLEKLKDRGLPLVDILSVDFEKKEQVGILTIRDLLSDLKKDII